jgi:hypothetical protein
MMGTRLDLRKRAISGITSVGDARGDGGSAGSEDRAMDDGDDRGEVLDIAGGGG